MSAMLGYVPIFASFVLGIQYLWAGDGSTVTKVIGAVLLQVALALTLEFWRRML